MNDNTMIKISLLIIILGIPALLFVSYKSAPETNNAQLLSDQEIININGTITKIRNRETTTTAILTTQVSIPITFFDVVRLDEGQRVKLIAKKDSYNQKHS